MVGAERVTVTPGLTPRDDQVTWGRASASARRIDVVPRENGRRSGAVVQVMWRVAVSHSLMGTVR